MVVRQAIIVGRGSRFASSSAAETAFHIMAVGVDHLPSGEPEASAHILGDGEIGAAVVGHPVVVPEHAKLAEAQVAGQRNDLLRDAFLQAAVADKRPRAVVDDVVAECRVEPGLGDGHADGIGDTLPERARRDLDPEIGRAFGMSMRVGAEFAEALDLIERETRIPGQVQQRIDQHRAVAVRHDEAVAVEPERIGRIAPDVAGEQRGGDFRAAERRARMAFLGALDRIERQEANGVGHAIARLDLGTCGRRRSQAADCHFQDTCCEWVRRTGAGGSEARGRRVTAENRLRSRARKPR